MHQRVHFNVRDFKCEICQAAFKQQGELNRHFQRLHSGITTKCLVCDYESNFRNVQVHLNRTHGLLGYRWDAKNAEFVKMTN